MASSVPTAVPVLARPRGVAVPVIGLEDENVYKDGEDPEIEALFDESRDPLHSAEGGALQDRAEQTGISLITSICSPIRPFPA